MRHTARDGTRYEPLIARRAPDVVHSRILAPSVITH